MGLCLASHIHHMELRRNFDKRIAKFQLKACVIVEEAEEVGESNANI